MSLIDRPLATSIFSKKSTYPYIVSLVANEDKYRQGKYIL